MQRERSKAKGPGELGDHNSAIKAAKIAATATVVGALITAAALIAANLMDDEKTLIDSEPNGQVAEPSQGPPSCPDKKITFTAPTPDIVVDGRKGVETKGEACGLKNEYGWLFEYDPFDCDVLHVVHR